MYGVYTNTVNIIIIIIICIIHTYVCGINHYCTFGIQQVFEYNILIHLVISRMHVHKYVLQVERTADFIHKNKMISYTCAI